MGAKTQDFPVESNGAIINIISYNINSTVNAAMYVLSSRM